jgi:hypothetical protein
MELEASLRCSQELTTGPYPKQINPVYIPPSPSPFLIDLFEYPTFYA